VFATHRRLQPRPGWCCHPTGTAAVMRWAAALSAATSPEVCPVVLFDCAGMLQLLGFKCAVHWVDICITL
jgi:hypothetical protein